MDPATLVGIVMGFGMIIGSIALKGALAAFVDPPSMLIVVGGTLATTLVMETMENVIGAFKVAKNAFFQRRSDVISTIKTILELSGVARKQGILELEKTQIEDGFLAKGIRMAVCRKSRSKRRLVASSSRCDNATFVDRSCSSSWERPRRR